MVATGGSVLDTVEHLKNVGVKKIKVLAIIVAPEGIKAIEEKYPDTRFIEYPDWTTQMRNQ